MGHQERVIVAVPVRDEAARLPRFLAALGGQTVPPDLLCIAFDGCTDDSAGVVAAQAGALPFAIRSVTLERADPNAGRARRAAMALAAAEDAILLSTDADSLPDRDWIAANRAALAVADIATGRIVRDAEYPSPLQDRVEAYYDALFALRRRIDPVAWEAPITHHYTSAASLALRTDIYHALDGFEPRPAAEDARLIDRAHAAGYRVRRDAAIRVTTSSRRHGRTTDGLADHLRRLDDGTVQASMAHPADMAWRYHRHATARAAFAELGRNDLPANRSSRVGIEPVESPYRENRSDAADLSIRRLDKLDGYSRRTDGVDCTVRSETPNSQFDTLATHLARSRHDILRIAAGSINAEAFAMRIVPDIPGGERLVSLDVAERALAALDTRRVAA